jgi:hypothetical protein
VRIAGKGERIRARSRRERGGGIPSPNGFLPATPKAWILSIGPRRFAPTYTSGNFRDFFHGVWGTAAIACVPARSVSFFVIAVLPHSWCKLSPPKTCKQLKLCEIERFCTESLESASPGLIAQSDRLRISNFGHLFDSSTCTKSEEEPN